MDSIVCAVGPRKTIAKVQKDYDDLVCGRVSGRHGNIHANLYLLIIISLILSIIFFIPIRAHFVL